MAFDPFGGGHHPEYLHALASQWVRGARHGELTVACNAKTASDARLDELLAQSPGVLSHVELPGTSTTRSFGRFGADRAHARLLESVVARVAPDDLLIMYVDRMLAPLATGLRFEATPRLHGIYFRPSVHYPCIQSSSLSVGERARGYLRQALLAAALRNPSLSTIFSLDPHFAEWSGRLRSNAKVVPIPDVAYPSIDGAAVVARRAGWNIDPGRVTMLMFGVLGLRKGVGTLCEALTLLAPGDQARLAVVFCGRTLRSEEGRIAELLRTVSQQSAVQIVVDEADLHFTQVQSAFEATDVVLVPYLRHIGSSAVVLRAAAAGRPVIASDFGLVGHYVRTQSLGRVVDTRDAQALAIAIAATLNRPGIGFREGQALQFAQRHGPDEMATTIIESMSDMRAARAAEAA